MRRFFQIDKYNTAYDWGLVLTGQDLTPPAPKTNYVQLDGMSGSLDLTEALTGEVTYSDRTLTMTYTATAGTHADRVALLRTITALGNYFRARIEAPVEEQQ